MADTSPRQFMSDVKRIYGDESIVYVDVGAYIGDVFISLIKNDIVLEKAFLFEPNPESFKLLQENIKQYTHDAIIVNSAISNNSKDVCLFKQKSMTKVVSSDLESPNSELDKSKIFKINSTSLDDFFHKKSLSKINLLKIDVEGFEINVLKGMVNLLNLEAIDIIYIEVGFDASNNQQTYFADIDFLLRLYGYKIFKIYEQKNEWTRDQLQLRRANIAYISGNFNNVMTWSKKFN